MDINVIELSQQLEAKQAEYKTKWDAYPLKKLADGSESKNIPANDIEGLRTLMAEIEDIGAKYSEAKKVYDFAQENEKGLEQQREAKNRLGFGGTQAQAQKKDNRTLAERWFDSPEFKSRSRRKVDEFELTDFDVKGWLRPEFKATMTTGSDGYLPEVLRQPGITFSAQRPVQVAETLPMRPTTQNSIAFMTETVFTNTAASKAETGAAVEATLTYAESTAPIVRIPVFIPVSEVQFDDEPGLAQIVNERLTLMVLQELDSQIMVKTGSGTDMTGMFAVTGVQTQAKGTDPAFDALHKAITLGRVTGRVMPNVIYMHSTDWQNVKLTRTADGIYILGNPGDDIRPQLWGLPVVQTETLTASNALVVDTSYNTLVMRQGVEIAVTDSHASNFISGILAIRATIRAGLECRRGAANVKVTGL